MVPGGTSNTVTAKGLIKAGENAGFKLATGDDTTAMTDVTIAVNAECIVDIELTLPATGAGTTIPTMLRGILIEEGKEILAIETDPGAMVSATFTAR